ncbi:recombinase family protein [Micrococcus antarcticus]|uniref:recombinase family protein n=1 Tax=Micrococcus antarcticus TaxID=86171 RepID=UPI00384E5A2D
MSGQKGQLVGYARVSSADQSLARQLEALAGADRVFEEKASAKDRARPVLAEMLAYVREGDTVLVKSPDRLARSTVDLLNLLSELKAKGVAVRFVDSPALDTATAQGTFMLTVLGAVAELERELIAERRAEGIALAKKAGKYDRAPKLTAGQVQEARERVDAGVPKAVVAREMSVSRQTLYDALAGRGRYAGLE